MITSLGYEANNRDGQLQAEMRDCSTTIAMFILMVIIATVGMLAVK